MGLSDLLATAHILFRWLWKSKSRLDLCGLANGSSGWPCTKPGEARPLLQPRNHDPAPRGLLASYKHEGGKSREVHLYTKEPPSLSCSNPTIHTPCFTISFCDTRGGQQNCCGSHVVLGTVGGGAGCLLCLFWSWCMRTGGHRYAGYGLGVKRAVSKQIARGGQPAQLPLNH